MISLQGLGTIGFLESVGCYLLFSYEISSWSFSSLTWLVIAFSLALLALLASSFERLQIAFTGYALGVVFSLGLANFGSPFGTYLTVLSTFHFSEFVTTGLTNPKNLSFDSYLVNHSKAYGFAALASWIEYFLFLYLTPWLKSFHVLSSVGFFMCVVGEIVRKWAMFHAGKNFNHIVQDRKHPDHQLVTSGIYNLCRHPSYMGWYMWSVGTQLILLNPICLVAYAYVSFLFFQERIYVEEYALLNFFGKEYRAYQERVWTGIPLIKGYMHPI